MAATVTEIRTASESLVSFMQLVLSSILSPLLKVHPYMMNPYMILTLLKQPRKPPSPLHQTQCLTLAIRTFIAAFFLLHASQFFFSADHSAVSKESAGQAGDEGLIPESRRSPGGGNSNPLQYPCLENPMDRGALQATVHWVTEESDTTKRLRNKIR